MMSATLRGLTGTRLALVGLALTAGLGGTAFAREPLVPREQLQAGRYIGVAPVPGGEGAAVALAVGNGARVVPIFIGLVEAAAIARAEQGLRPPRPLTHELLGEVIDATGATLRTVVIDDMRDGTYFATLELGLHDGGRVWVDARPSDGLALAVGRDIPILLGPAVVASATDPDQPGRGTGPFILTRLAR